jgi:hypothetical protein
MDLNLTPEQAAHVSKFQQLYTKLSDIEFRMIELQHEAKLLLEELEGLRDLENKLFSNEK